MRLLSLPDSMPITADRTTEEPRRASTNGVRTTVVLPAYNEGAALPRVLDELGRYLDNTYEVLVEIGRAHV